MKIRRSAVLILIIVFFVICLAFTEGRSRRKKHRKRDTLSIKSSKPNARGDSLFDTASLITNGRNKKQLHRRSPQLTKKNVTKKKKPRTKSPEKQRLRVRLVQEFDDTKHDSSNTTFMPTMDNNYTEIVVTTAPSTPEMVPEVLDNNFRPGFLPHETKRKCGRCIWQECPPVDVMIEHCPSGVVRDQCNCCVQCANGVGMPCYMSSFSPVWLPPCGDDLECVPVQQEKGDEDLDSTWGDSARSEGICACTDLSPICGSNNATYDNICEFREASSRLQIYTNKTVTVLHQGPCKTAPKIDSPPLDVTTTSRSFVSFRCETSGYPLPRIQWFKIIQKKKKTLEEELPGYLSHAVTQMRGGPGKYQLTTWLTLDHVKESDSGTYICRSSNQYGTADGQAILSISES